jgi:Flp pilus assembly protein TadG
MKLNSERGQSLVELAISLLILIYLLSGAVEFGIAFFQYVQLRDAAQEGALYGSMNPGDLDGIEARIRASSTSPIDLTTLASGDIVISAPTPCEGNPITVTVSYDHTVFMPFMSRIIGPTVDLDATVTDTILTPVCP